MRGSGWASGLLCAGIASLVAPAMIGMAAVTPGEPRPSPLCDGGRTSVSYRSRTVLPGAPPATMCRYDVSAVGMEPSFVFTTDGRIMYQTWGVSQGTVAGLPAIPGVRRSDPTWTHWEEVTPAGVNQHANSLDPYIYRDPYTRRVFSVDWAASGSPLCATISATDDSGATWTTSPAACAGFDGQSIGAGPPVTSHPIGYADLVYYCTGTTLGSSPPTTTPLCAKSIDGGLTFLPTGMPPYPAVGPSDVFGPWAGNPVVAADGTLYLPKRFGGQPQLAISRDEGATWHQVMVATNGATGEATRVAVDNRGAIYYTWTGNDHQPYLAWSRDGGAAWSAPLLLSPPGLREAALPRIAVDRPGRVAVVYLGSTNAPGHEPYYADCNVLLSDCVDGPYTGATWNGYMTLVDDVTAAQPLLTTTTVNAPSAPLFTGGCSSDGACKGVLDFLDVHFDASGAPWGAYVDDCQLTRSFTPVFNTSAGPCEDGVGEAILGRMLPAATAVVTPAGPAGPGMLPPTTAAGPGTASLLILLLPALLGWRRLRGRSRSAHRDHVALDWLAPRPDHPNPAGKQPLVALEEGRGPGVPIAGRVYWEL